MWVRSDRKLISATDNDMQGLGGDLMALVVVSFPDGRGGWINMLEKLYFCTTIPFAL